MRVNATLARELKVLKTMTDEASNPLGKPVMAKTLSTQIVKCANLVIDAGLSPADTVKLFNLRT